MRKLSQQFMDDLLGGKLKPLLQRVLQDDTLILSIRDNWISIYYRGGTLFEVRPFGGGYRVTLDRNYHNDHPNELLEFPFDVNDEISAMVLVRATPELKYAIDRHISTKKDISERECQQLVARENNFSRISNATEYFIVDIEVSETELGAKFDMLAVRWLATERQFRDKLVPVVIEVKFSESSLTGTSGLVSHLKDAFDLRKNQEKWKNISETASSQFNQLHELGLLRFNLNQGRGKFELNDKATPELIFLLANYNPRATVLVNILQDMKTATTEIRNNLNGSSGFNVLFLCQTLQGTECTPSQ